MRLGDPNPPVALEGRIPSARAATRMASEVGVVTRVDARAGTCDAQGVSGRVAAGVPWPSGGPGQVCVPVVGDNVEIRWDLGEPPSLDWINRTVPAPKPARVGVVSSQDALSNMGVGFDPGAFGLQPGDKVWVSASGSGIVSQLSDGTFQARASEVCKLVLSPYKDAVEIVGARMALRSAAGELAFTSDGGKTGMSLRLGADEATESHPERQVWRVEMDLGQQGDLVNLRVCDPKGRPVWGHHVLPGGVVESFGAGWDHTDGPVVMRLESLKVETLAGMDVTAGGPLRLRGSGVDVSSLGGLKLRSGAALSMRSMGPMSLTATAGLRIGAVGSILPNPLTNAFAVTASNGSAVFDVGNPLAGDIQSAQSSFDVSVWGTGQAQVSTYGFGGVTLGCAIPQGIRLGGPGTPRPAPYVPGPFGAVLYEQIMAALAAFGAALDAHVHATTTPGAPTSPPVVPPWASTSAGFAAARSLYVTLGG